MKKIIIVRYGEIILKGNNKRFFEDKLAKHIRNALGDLGKLKVYKSQSRIYIDAENYDQEQIINRVKRVFGVVSVSPALIFDVDLDQIKEIALQEIIRLQREKGAKTFKVESKRVDKKFPIQSLELNREIGGHILKNTENMSVDVHHPEILLKVEVRDQALVLSEVIEGLGGLPMGTNGKALLLLSGGIDSPVAGWLVGKRGVEIEAIHFHSYPFTSERAKEKVIDLAKILSSYCGEFKMHSVNLLPIQKEINEKCPEDEMTIISRRFMMRIAERVAKSTNCDALITGESIGQVASQTVQSLHVTNSTVELPVFRPLIAMDKVDIISLANKIGTFETSILPFEDCCTVFLPKRPVTKPRLEKIERSEQNLDVEALIESAIENMEEEMITLD